ncbi:MAG: hypothetical protein WBH28_17425 [Fuerstiella sp.]
MTLRTVLQTVRVTAITRPDTVREVTWTPIGEADTCDPTAARDLTGAWHL